MNDRIAKIANKIYIAFSRISQYFKACIEGDLETVKDLLDGRKVNVDEKNFDNETAFMIAYRRKQFDVAKFLLSRKANVNNVDRFGLNALFSACNRGFEPNEVKLLLDYGADVNLVTTKEKYTPLMHASMYGRIEIMNLLLTHGANVELKSFRGRTALDYAKDTNQKKAVELLQKYGAK